MDQPWQALRSAAAACGLAAGRSVTGWRLQGVARSRRNALAGCQALAERRREREEVEEFLAAHLAARSADAVDRPA